MITKTMLFKIVGTALFTNFVALLFIVLYHTDALFSTIIASLWTVTYGIKLYKENIETLFE